MSKDYYKTLGIEKGANQEEIKKAFRKLAHKLHPDKPTGDEAKFKEINEAYQVLGDETKRKQYDQYGADFQQQGGFGAGMSWDDFMRATRGQGGQQAGGFDFGNVDLGDIFGDMFGFGGGRSRSRQVQGRDIQVDVQLSFREGVFGTEKEIKLTKQNACSVCDGSGAEPGSNMKQCDQCAGQGQVRRVQQTIMGAMQTVVNCSSCQGQGSFPEKKCKHCDGVGAQRSESKMMVKIPQGIHDGATIRLTGKGEHPGVRGVAGDLYVVVHIQQDQNFTREENDIFTTAHINIYQAIMGDKIPIETLEGEKTLVIPAGTQSQQKFKLKELGVPYLRGSGRGDQYVTVIVDIPKKVNKKAKQLLEELKKELD